jgi:hypothetical protein
LRAAGAHLVGTADAGSRQMPCHATECPKNATLRSVWPLSCRPAVFRAAFCQRSVPLFFFSSLPLSRPGGLCRWRARVCRVPRTGFRRRCRCRVVYLQGPGPEEYVHTVVT